MQIPFAESGDIAWGKAGGEILRHFPLPYDVAGGGEDKGEAVLVFFGQPDAFFGQEREAVVFCRILDDLSRDFVHIAEDEAALIISSIMEDGADQEDQVCRSQEKEEQTGGEDIAAVYFYQGFHGEAMPPFHSCSFG